MLKQKEGKPNRYDAIILRLFKDNYREGITEFEITRDIESLNPSVLLLVLAVIDM